MRKGWQKRPLGELADLRGRIGWRGLTAKEYTKSGPLFLSVHSLNYGDYVDLRDAFHISEERYAESPEIMLREHDVLICKDGAGIGKVGIVGKLSDRATINSSLLLVRGGKEIHPKFLYHCLSSPYFQEIVNSRLNGATTPHLYQRDITEFPVVVPPLPEQQRIVGILDKAFSAIAIAKGNAEKSRQNARAIFESHTQSIFNRSGNGWVEKTLEEVVAPDCTLSYGIVQPGDEYLHGLPVVRPTDLTMKVVSLSGLKRIDPRLAGGYKRTTLHGGELLLCVRGSTGVVSMASAELTGANVTRGIVPIRFNRSLLTPDFGFHLISSGPVQSQIREKTYGTALMQINIRDLRRIALSFPNLKSQEMISVKLNELGEETYRLAMLYERKLAALETLKASLLHQAFAGQL